MYVAQPSIFTRLVVSDRLNAVRRPVTSTKKKSRRLDGFSFCTFIFSLLSTIICRLFQTKDNSEERKVPVSPDGDEFKSGFTACLTRRPANAVQRPNALLSQTPRNLRGPFLLTEVMRSCQIKIERIASQQTLCQNNDRSRIFNQNT